MTRHSEKSRDHVPLFVERIQITHPRSLAPAPTLARSVDSQATIAKLACCSERTVANALQWLRLWGFLSWQRRLKRIAGRLGTVTRQTSNAYRLVLSGLAAIGARALPGGAERNNYSPSPIRAVMLSILGQEKTGGA